MCRRVLLVSIVALVLLPAVAACGGDTGGRGDAVTVAACREGGDLLVDALESSLTAQGGGQLRRVRTVEVQGGPDAPLTLLKKGAYIASGTLVAPSSDQKTLSWVVSDTMLTTGGGLAYALDRVTGKASGLGSAAKAGSPARDYVTAIANSAAYEQARACARDVSNAIPAAKSTAKSKPKLSHATFITKLNRLCRRGTAALEKVSDASLASKDPDVVASAFDASVRQYDAVLSKLEKLAVPAADRPAFDEYVTSITRSRGVAAQIADKLRSQEQAAHLVKALTDEKQERLLAALTLGADDCG